MTAAASASEPTEPAWLAIARREIGVHETPGPGSTSRIDEYLAAAHAHPGDEQPWCSAFMCWVMERAGIPSTGRMAARSWLAWGVPLEKPRSGAVTVLWRGDPNGPHGHVGFWLREDASSVYLLGGNQANAVGVRAYAHARVMGCRWRL